MRRIKQAMLLFVVLSLTACESGKEAMTSPQSNPQDAKKAANPWETPASLSLFMAEKIEDSGDAAIALSDIASALAEAGDKAQALAICP